MKAVDHAAAAAFGQVVKPRAAAVRPRHIPHDAKPQAVSALIQRAFAAFKPLELFLGKARTCIANGKAQAAALPRKRNPYCATLGVMPHAVANQIFQHASKQLTITM